MAEKSAKGGFASGEKKDTTEPKKKEIQKVEMVKKLNQIFYTKVMSK